MDNTTLQIIIVAIGFGIAMCGYILNVAVCIILNTNLDLVGKWGNVALAFLTLIPFASFIMFLLLLVVAAALTLIKEALA